jgi:DNA repair protein RadC
MSRSRVDDDRPRERLARLGGEALSDAELLALLLRTGGRGADALGVASAMLAERGGLLGVARSLPGELAAHAGIGRAKAASLAAALEVGRRVAARTLREGDALRSPADVHRAYHPRLRDALHERFVVVLLDGRHRVLRDVTVSQGTLTASLVHPREVLRPAIRESAAAVILVHNHPSGDPTPSREDRLVTRRLARAGALLGVEVVDHVVVAERGYVSLRETGGLDGDGDESLGADPPGAGGWLRSGARPVDPFPGTGPSCLRAPGPVPGERPWRRRRSNAIAGPHRAGRRGIAAATSARPSWSASTTPRSTRSSPSSRPT